mmetsp:Transcript_15751/g.35363  ORF Transcript_15751/g.35363 Transcript_15751/m.35363 type:complete len:167 (+) Transcript_15751:14-514(+)
MAQASWARTLREYLCGSQCIAMSSIHDALYRDSRKGKPPMPNFVALTSHQEKQGSTSTDDFHLRLQERRAEERNRRLAEGGRGGGYNDRQDPQEKKPSTNNEDDFEIDEFGRRRRRGVASAASKSARAEAALARLRRMGTSKADAEPKDASGHREGGKDRSRSRGG